MNELSHAQKVVHMRQFASRLDPQAESLVRKIQDITLTVLSGLIRGMLDRADDTLFDLADNAKSNSYQQLYFDAMREIRLKRNAIEQGAIDAVKSSFDWFVAGKSPDEACDGAELSLELVDTEDMEELIAIKNMSAKAARECHQELFEVTVRLAAASRRNDLGDDAHPLSPGAIASAFGDAVKPLDLDIRIKLIIYKLFEKSVMSEISELHKQVNALLVREGILPKVKRSVRRGSDTARRSATQRNEFPVSQDDPNGMVPHVPAGWSGLFGDDLPGGAVYHGTGLVGALSAMQNYVAEHGYPGAMSPAQVGTRVLHLAQEINAGSGKDSVRVAQERTINMVSMIFEYVLEDQNIPDPVKAQIARLQIPVLKVALLDEDFFGRNKHPARSLLNELARASIGCVGNEEYVTAKVSAVVEGVLNHFEDDPSIFASLLEEFRGFLAEEEDRSRVFEERTRKTTEGKERVEFIKRRTEAWVDMWASRPGLPEFIREFLNNTWKNTLLVTMHRHGEESSEWAARIRAVNNLLWSITPKKTAKGGKLLVEMLPGIIAEIREGMELASAHPGTIDAFLERLARLHACTVNGGLERESPATGSEEQVVSKAGIGSVTASESRPGPESIPATAEPESCSEEFEESDLAGFIGIDPSDDGSLDSAIPVLREVVEEIVLSQADERPEPQERDAYFNQVEALTCGTWLEFLSDGEEPVRAKLSWKSPLTGCYLFVNRKGAKFAEKTVAGLAAELRGGRATILEQAPLIDRAISAVCAPKLEMSPR